MPSSQGSVPAREVLPPEVALAALYFLALLYEFVINGPNGDNLYLVMETLGTSVSAMVTIGDNFSDRLTLYVAVAIAVHIAMGCGTS